MTGTPNQPLPNLHASPRFVSDTESPETHGLRESRKQEILDERRRLEVVRVNLWAEYVELCQASFKYLRKVQEAERLAAGPTRCRLCGTRDDTTCKCSGYSG